MSIVITDVLMSPPAGVSAADRFSSPSPGSAKRRLFSVLTQPQETPVSSAENSSTDGSSSSTKTTQIIAFQQAQTNDGRQVDTVLINHFMSGCIN